MLKIKVRIQKKSCLYLWIIGIAAVSFLSSCSLISNLAPDEDQEIEEVSHLEIPQEAASPGIKENVHTHLVKSIDRSLEYLYKQDADKTVKMFKDTDVNQLIMTLHDLREKALVLGEDRKLINYIKDNYTFYKYGSGNALITGYYEAQLNGSLKRTARYRYPLYKHPSDIVKVELKKFSQLKERKDVPDELVGREYKKGRIGPYYSRKEIESGKVLAKRQQELVWVDDPVDLFFLQIQGSGIITFENGKKMNVNFAGSNGQLYRSIGDFLIKRGKISRQEMTAQKIKKYLRDHPQEAQEIFEYNPSYSFFREVKEGPLGCIGVPVTAYRSIATDGNFFPRGAPALIITKIPQVDEAGEVTGHRDFVQIVMNQDTGGAIKGPARVDLFTGRGQLNENIAGSMKRDGKLYFFVKKNNINKQL